MKDLNEWTRKEFEALPFRESWDKDVECHSLVILPLRAVHDSGYRCIDFVAVTKEGPTCRLSGCSDVIHIDGTWPRPTESRAWSIDCLRKSGLLRLFSPHRNILAGAALSSFDVYLKPRPEAA